MKRYIFITISVLLLPVFAFGATHYVSSDGSATWAASTDIGTPCSLATANANAVAGDTIYLRAGTYSTYISPTNSGTSGNYITFEAYAADGQWTVILSGTYGFNLIEKDYIKVKGIYFYNTGTNWGRIHGNSSTGASGDYNWIDACKFYQSGHVTAGVEFRYGARYNKISNSEFPDAPLSGDVNGTLPHDFIKSYSNSGKQSGYNVFEYNKFGKIAHASIGTDNTLYNVVRGNVVDGSLRRGFGMGAGGSDAALVEYNIVLFSGNDIRNNPIANSRDENFYEDAGIQSYSPQITRYNRFAGNGTPFFFGANCNASGSICVAGTEQRSDKSRIYHNTFYGDYYGPWSTNNSKDVYYEDIVIKNNIFWDNAVRNWDFIANTYTQKATKTITVDNNLFENGHIFDYKSVEDPLLATVETAYPTEWANNVTSDPVLSKVYSANTISINGTTEQILDSANGLLSLGASVGDKVFIFMYNEEILADFTAMALNPNAANLSIEGYTITTIAGDGSSITVAEDLTTVAGDTDDQWYLFVNNAELSYGSLSGDFFKLKNTSNAINAAAWLTTITSATQGGAGSTSFVVDDSRYFYDGWGIPGETGDVIYTQNGQSATITDVNYTTHTITVDAAITWTQNEGITTVNYVDGAPDIGALEFGDAYADLPHYFTLQLPAGNQSIILTGSVTLGSDVTDPEGLTPTYLWTANGTAIANDELAGSNTDADPGAWTPTESGDFIVRCAATIGSLTVYSTAVTISVTESGSSITKTIGENDADDYSGMTDAYIQYGAATTNYGTSSVLRISNNSTDFYDRRSFLSFPSTDLAGKTATAAKLALYVTVASDTTADLYSVTDTWVEDQATWTVYSTGNAWSDATNSRDTLLATKTLLTTDGVGWQFWEGANLVTYINTQISAGNPINLGLFPNLSTAEGSPQFYSSEGANGYRPYLSVTYAGSASATSDYSQDTDVQRHFELGDSPSGTPTITYDTEVGEEYWTNNNAATSTTGTVGNAASFASGSSQYLSHAGSADDFGMATSGEGTVMFMFQVTDSTADRPIFFKNSADKKGFNIEINANNTVDFWMGKTGGTQWTGWTTTATADDNDWHAAVFSFRDSDEAGMYYLYNITDSALVETSTGTFAAELAGYEEDGTLYIGASGGGNYFHGAIDEVVVLDRYITVQEAEAYAKKVYPPAIIGNIELITPDGTTLGIDDPLTVKLNFTRLGEPVSVTYTDGGANPQIEVEAGDTDLTLLCTSASGTTDTALIFSGTVAEGMASADATVKASSFSLGAGTITYGTPNASVSLALSATDLGSIVIDGTPPTLAAQTVTHCDSDGTQIDDATTYENGESFYVFVTSDGDSLYHANGPASNLKVGFDFDLGTDDAQYYSGLGTNKLIFKVDVTNQRVVGALAVDGTAEDVGLIHGATDLFDSASNEITYTLSDTAITGGAITVGGGYNFTLGDGGEYADFAAADLAVPYYLAGDTFSWVGYSDWVITRGGTDLAVIDSGEAQLTNVDSGATYFQKTQSVTAGSIGKLIFDAKGDGSVAGRYSIYDLTNSADIVAITSTGITAAAYSSVRKYFIVPATCTSVGVRLYAPSAAGAAYFDNIQLVGIE